MKFNLISSKLWKRRLILYFIFWLNHVFQMLLKILSRRRIYTPGSLLLLVDLKYCWRFIFQLFLLLQRRKENIYYYIKIITVSGHHYTIFSSTSQFSCINITFKKKKQKKKLRRIFLSILIYQIMMTRNKLFIIFLD